MNRSTRTSIRQRGVAAVELAIILPVFGILLLGVLEIGSMARDHQVLQNAAREGARFSALPNNRMDKATNPATVQTRIQDRVRAYLANEGITVANNNITVNQTYIIKIGGLDVEASQIIVTYNRPLVFPRITGLIPLSGTTLTGTAVFRNFY